VTHEHSDREDDSCGSDSHDHFEEEDIFLSDKVKPQIKINFGHSYEMKQHQINLAFEWEHRSSIDAKGPFECELLSAVKWRQSRKQVHLETVSFLSNHRESSSAVDGVDGLRHDILNPFKCKLQKPAELAYAVKKSTGMKFPGKFEDEASLISFPTSFPASKKLTQCVLNDNCCINERVLHPFQLDIQRLISANQIQDFTTELDPLERKKNRKTEANANPFHEESLSLSKVKEKYFEEKMMSGFEKNQFKINQADLNTSSVSLILQSSIPTQAATASSKKAEKCSIRATKSEETFTELYNRELTLNSQEKKVYKVKQEKSIKRNLPLKKRRIRLAFEEIDLNVVVTKSPQNTKDIKARKATCKFAYV